MKAIILSQRFEHKGQVMYLHLQHDSSSGVAEPYRITWRHLHHGDSHGSRSQGIDSSWGLEANARAAFASAVTTTVSNGWTKTESLRGPGIGGLRRPVPAPIKEMENRDDD